MAAVAHPLRTAANLASLLPNLSSPVLLASSRSFALYSRQLSHPLLPALSLAIPAIQLNLPTLLGDIWESILRAVPKKKTSHMKKRHRQMANGKLADITSLCRCPGCGQLKRMHRICPHCMGSRSPPRTRLVRNFANGFSQKSWRYGDRKTRLESLYKSMEVDDGCTVRWNRQRRTPCGHIEGVSCINTLVQKESVFVTTCVRLDGVRRLVQMALVQELADGNLRSRDRVYRHFEE
jgi:large subunit ribosomal protein L32